MEDDAEVAVAAEAAAEGPPTLADALRTHASLPYVDHEYEDEALQALVEALIDEEAARTPPPAPVPPPELGFSSPLLQEEMRRVAAGQALRAIDLERYKAAAAPIPAPSELDALGLQELSARLRAAIEYEATRVGNVQLLARFGAQAWRLHNEQVAADLAAHLRALEAEKLAALRTNRKRQRAQLEAGAALGQLESEFQAQLAKNAELAVVCERLAEQVKRLRQRAEAAAPP